MRVKEPPTKTASSFRMLNQFMNLELYFVACSADIRHVTILQILWLTICAPSYSAVFLIFFISYNYFLRMNFNLQNSTAFKIQPVQQEKNSEKSHFLEMDFE